MTGPSRSIIDTYLGLGSRYSYLAFTQLDRIERETGCRFRLFPISSVELMALRPVSPFAGAPVSGQYDWDYRRRDAEMWAAYYGVPFIEPYPMPADHRLLARACRAAGRQDDLRGYCAGLFRAIFAEHRRIDDAACAAVAAERGLDRVRFAGDLDSGDVDRQVSEDAREAQRRGAFGVPTFFAGPAMYWGNDRLVLLEAHLRGRW